MSDTTRRLLLLTSLAAVSLAGCGDDDSSIARDMAAPADGEAEDMGDPTGDMGDPPISECTAEGMGTTIGESCLRDLDCSDACFCNGVELCMEGVCVVGEAPCGRFECSTGSCDEATRTCDETPDDSRCDDGVFCNGAERCDPEFGCRPGTPPFCGDGDICTIDSCDEEAGMCTHAILDADMDGAAARSCGGADCDDTTADRAPGNTEICGNGIDDDCNNRVDANDLACAPTNDRCTDEGDGRGPLDITRTTDGTSVIATSTVGMDGDYDSTCGESSEDSGPDAVFTFTLAETKDVSAEVQGIGNNAILSLRTLESCSSDSDMRCSDTNTGVQPFVMANSLPAGDYALVVITATETAFDLAFTVAPPTTLDLSVDSCDTTMADLSAGGSLSGSFVGDPRYEGDELSNSHSIPCRSGSSSYADVAFTLSVPSGEFRDVRIEGRTFSSSGFGRRPYLALVDDCDVPTAATVRCVESPSNGDPAVLDLRSLPGGDYFVVLEEDFTSDEGWEIDVTVSPAGSPAAGDRCVLGSPVDISAGSGAIDLATLEHSPDVGPFCRENGPSATDAFFEFTLASSADVVIETSSSPTVRHMVAYSSACGDVDADGDCFSGSTGTSSRRFERLPAGTHYVNVTTLETEGTITATLTVEPPTPAPPNNECSSAIALPANSSVAIDLPEYDDNGDFCGATRALDAFYTFTLATETDVALRAVNAQRLTLLSGGCGGTETCAVGSPPRIEERLAAGTYVVVVEADELTASSDTTLYFSTF